MSFLPKTYISWDRFEAGNCELAKKIKASGQEFDHILGINRGGAITAVVVSHLLAIKQMSTLTLQMRSTDAANADFKEPEIYGTDILKMLEGTRVLVADDAVGSGKTLVELMRLLGRNPPALVKTAATVWNMEEHRECPADFYGDTTPGWIVFPWERNV